jgi:hypothetical protein
LESTKKARNQQSNEINRAHASLTHQTRKTKIGINVSHSIAIVIILLATALIQALALHIHAITGARAL